MSDANLKAAIENGQTLAAYVDRLLNGDAQGKKRTVGFALLYFPTGVTDGSRVN